MLRPARGHREQSQDLNPGHQCVQKTQATCPGCMEVPPGAYSPHPTQTLPEKETPSLSWPNADAKTRHRKGKSDQPPAGSIFHQYALSLKPQVFTPNNIEKIKNCSLVLSHNSQPSVQKTMPTLPIKILILKIV